MLRGLTTVSFYADDVIVAARWYVELLGVEPYFVRPLDGPPAYVEFRIGDALDELGIIDRRYAAHPTAAPGGAVVHWHVDDVAAARERLLELGPPSTSRWSPARPASSRLRCSTRSATSSGSCTTRTTSRCSPDDGRAVPPRHGCSGSGRRTCSIDRGW